MIVDVAVPFRVNTSFHYSVEPELAAELSPGSLVEIPLGRKQIYGFVLGFPTETNVPADKLKSVTSRLSDGPIFDEVMLKFLKWVSQYYCHPLGEVLDAAIPRPNLKKKTRPSKPRKELDFGVLGGDHTERPTLTEEQAKVLGDILNPEEKRPFLLHGVTGSGKTEVYLRALDEIQSKGGGAIILVPEISLTPQLMGRFAARFPGKIAVLHSDLTPVERAHQWEKVRSGAATVVIGARSAIFAPVKNLGLIVVDEEQESSFKQEDSLRYHARDLAVVRAQMSGAKVILGSATPSLESYSNARSGRYCYLQMTQRVENRPLPSTTFIDIKDKATWYSEQTPWLSTYLVERLSQILKDKQQSVLYLNRLGFANFLFCKDCGHSWRCPNCDVSLTYYRHPPGLKCHYCGLHGEVPRQCEACEGTELDTMGLGTEQVENQLKAIFPEARIGRMDRGAIKNRKDLETVLTQVANRSLDIVIGTQMVAKGHDFPGIALVGVLIADSSLNMPDFRANERTFQILTQVSGRAGRAGRSGEVVVQTINPEQPVLRWAAENRPLEFYTTELKSREAFGFPPFKRLALLRFQHVNDKQVAQYANEIVALARREISSRGFQCQLLGPSEAPLARIKNLYRWHAMVKADSVKDMQRLLRILQAYDIQKKGPVQFAMDIDPLNSM